jgi:23S rRNA (adenine2503-C2)-methyltransferase
MPPILELTSAALRNWFVEHDLPAYRAGQVRKWLFQKRAVRFDEMSDVPAALRQQLAAEFQVYSTQVVQHREASDGSEKLLLELADAQRIECVLLRDDKDHCTACISTQVGCAMGCAFCATGIDGFVRNLTTGEIIEQLLQLQQLLPPRRTEFIPIQATGNERNEFRLTETDTERNEFRSTRASTERNEFRSTRASTERNEFRSAETPERLSHVVVMGMGEPLLNLDALLPALAVAADRDGLGIGARRITISTVGLPEGIRRLGREKCQYHLAVSLHASNDTLRNEIVPANRGFGIAAVLAAADDYFEQTGRRVTFEYVLLAGVNDQPEHAAELLRLLRGRPALVNLIPYNPVSGLPYRTPASSVTARFVEILTQSSLDVNIRHRKGDRIAAACGQLRRGQADSAGR